MAQNKKKPGRKIDLKKVTRLTTLAVFVAGSALTAMTAWFIMRTLNDIATVRGGSTSADFKVEGINIQLLDKLLEAQKKKASPENALPSPLRNPFRERPPAPSVSTPTPEPEPSPATTTPPPTTPSPTPTTGT
jgi:hypothetical protein